MAQLPLSDALLQLLHQRASQENLSIEEMIGRWLNTPADSTHPVALSRPAFPTDPLTHENRITAAKRAEEALRQNEAFVYSVLQSSLGGVMVFRAVRDSGGTIIDFEWLLLNAAMERMMGMSAADVIGRRQLELFPSDRENGIFDHYVQVVESGEARTFEQYFDVPFRLWVMFSAVRLEDGVAVSYHDITSLKTTETALREVKNLYDDLVERIPGMVYRLRWHPQTLTTYEYISPRVREFHGLELAAVYADGEAINRQMHPDDVPTALREMPVTPDSLKPVLWEGRYIVAGKIKWLRRASRPTYLSDGSVIWDGIETDITLEIEAREARHIAEDALHEQKRLEALLQQEQHMNTLQTQLIRTVSHEYRTPLAIITTCVNILERYHDRLIPEERLKRLSTIHFQIRQLTGLLDDTTEVLRGMVHGTGFQPRPINLEQLCQVTMNEIQTTLGEHHRLHFASDGQVTYAQIDDRLISRVLVNLLSNAVKYSPPNTNIRLELAQHENTVVLRVIDEGQGIAPEDIERLFEPFFRASAVRGLPGTGLGLPIVKDCVEMHGGSIDVDSILHVGSTFTVYLPNALSSLPLMT